MRTKGKISPSMMCADFLNLGNDIKIFEQFGIDYLHIDIMDGIFVPNYTLGVDYVKKIKQVTNIPVDIHFMVDKPEDKIDWFDFGENDYVSFHYEATSHAHRVVQKIKARNAKAMLALCPATPLSVLEELHQDLDAVLIMTVNPGFAGQALVESTLKKISKVRDLYPELEIEVDGNVSFENAVKMRAAGADIFVAGTSSIFTQDSFEENIKKLRTCIQ